MYTQYNNIEQCRKLDILKLDVLQVQKFTIAFQTRCRHTKQLINLIKIKSMECASISFIAATMNLLTKDECQKYNRINLYVVLFMNFRRLY